MFKMDFALVSRSMSAYFCRKPLDSNMSLSGKKSDSYVPVTSSLSLISYVASRVSELTSKFTCFDIAVSYDNNDNIIV